MSGAPEGKSDLVKKRILSQNEIDSILAGTSVEEVIEKRKKSHWCPSHKDYNIFRKNEWPFDNYSSQLEKLEAVLGEIVYFTGDLVNSNYKKIVDIIDMRKTKGINPKLFEPRNPEQIYPHSILLEDGTAENLRNIAVIMQWNFDILKDTTIENMDKFDFYKDHPKMIFFNPIQTQYWSHYFCQDNI